MPMQLYSVLLEDKNLMHDQVRQISMFASVFLCRKSFQKKSNYATWLIDDRVMHSHTNLFFSIKFKNNLSARKACNFWGKSNNF